MTKNIYDDGLINQLQKHPCVKNMSKKSILYQPEFKLKAVLEYKKGKKPVQIFSQEGFDLNRFDADYARNCIRRWALIYDTHGAEGLLTDCRVKKSNQQTSEKSNEQ